MDTIIFTNILFSALSVFIIIVTAGFIFLAVYVVLILRKIHNFLNVIKIEAEKIGQDIESLRGKVKGGGVAFASFVANALSFFKKHQKKSK